MSPSGTSIRETVESAVRRVRRDGVLATALAVAALVPSGLLLAWVAGPGARLVRGAGPLVLLGLGILAAAGLAVWLARRWVRSVDDAVVAAAAERRTGLPQGSLRGLLELGREVPAGTSAALVRRSEAQLAGRMAGTGAREVAGDVGERARRRRLRLLGVAGALTVLTVLAAFGTPERARGAWSPLLSPVATLTGPGLPPLAVHPGHADVARGQSLAVQIEAPYRERVLVRWRATGDVPRSRTVVLQGGRGGLELGPVDAPLEYRVEAPDGATSARFRVRPVDPLLVSELSVDVIYPPHVKREPETYAGEPPPLRVPEGTRLRIRGATTRPLRSVALVREDHSRQRATIQAAEFSLDWRPGVEESGQWVWQLVGAGETTEATPPAPLDLSVVADLPPIVRITVPEPEATMPAGFRQQVVADAADDHGLSAAALVFRRVTAGNQRGPETRVPLAVEPGADRLLLRGVLDASAEPLVPGDAIHYRVVVRDNAPGGQLASSAEHVLRLPSMAELREQARGESRSAMAEAERAAERTRDLQSATRDLSRQATGRSWEQRSGTPQGRPSEPGRLGFEEARQARDVLEGQEALLEEVAALEERMAALREAVDEAGLRDPEMQRRLQELQELYRQLADPESQGDTEALREALESLDPEAVREALERLADQQEELRRQMEESLELMRRAVAEQEMGALAREAEELSTQQEALAEAMREELPPPDRTPPAPTPVDSTRPDSVAPDSMPTDSTRTPAGATPPETLEAEERPGQEEGQEKQGGEQEGAQQQAGEQQGNKQEKGEEQGAEQQQGEGARMPQPAMPTPQSRAEQQEELGERAQKLNESMQSLQQQLMQIGEQQAAQQTGSAQQKGQSARQSMDQAAQQARQQQGEQASQSGARAASDLGDAAQQLESARQAMREGWQQEMDAAVQQATQEALSLAQREEALRQQMEQAQQQGGQQGQTMQQMRSEQSALQQGLRQLGQNLSEAAQQSGTMNRDVSQALARAMLNMQETMQAMQDGQMPVQQAGQAVESLNQLAMSLLQNEAGMRQQAGEPGQQAQQQLAELARQQASLNGQSGALAPMDLGQQAMQQQLEQLAQQQRAIARRMGTISEQMGAQENVLGRLDQLAGEAEALAREMDGGRLDPEVRARQERLFHRLLDAGRSLEREEYSDERVAEGAVGVPVGDPAALDPALLDPTLRFPAPTAERLRALPPAYRRLILEYFDRLNRAAGAAGGDGDGDGGDGGEGS